MGKPFRMLGELPEINSMTNGHSRWVIELKNEEIVLPANYKWKFDNNNIILQSKRSKLENKTM